MNVGKGQCVRVVPSRIRAGTLEGWLAAHGQLHTPAVRRQPGFVSKLLLQAEDDPTQVAMLLVWESSAQAIAWTKHLEHDSAGEPMRPFSDTSAGRGSAMPRGGWKVLEVVSPA
jgi:hypothetical protein